MIMIIESCLLPNRKNYICDIYLFKIEILQGEREREKKNQIKLIPSSTCVCSCDESESI